MTTEKVKREVIVAPKGNIGQTYADYILDGNQDEVEVQQVINGFLRSGVKIKLLPGVYYFNKPVYIEI